jgi:hypothetical protein
MPPGGSFNRGARYSTIHGMTDLSMVRFGSVLVQRLAWKFWSHAGIPTEVVIGSLKAI